MNNLDNKTDIHKQEQRIRDLINSPRKQYALLKQQSLWSQLCSSLDVIGDTELAIAAYKNKEFNQNTGAYYLVTYGVLQALFLQQDALFNLCESLGVKDRLDNYPRLKEIREDRNASIGHPTKLQRKMRTSYHFISRISLSNEGFDLASDNDNGAMVFRRIPISLLITDQHIYASQVLSAIITSLEQEEAVHKERFKMDKLSDALPQPLSYHLAKVVEGVKGQKPPEFGDANLKMVTNALQNFQETLERRGLELDTYDVVQEIYDLLAYPITELEAFFQYLAEGKISRINEQTAYIFAFFVSKQFERLKEVAREIDEEYTHQERQEEYDE